MEDMILLVVFLLIPMWGLAQLLTRIWNRPEPAEPALVGPVMPLDIWFERQIQRRQDLKWTQQFQQQQARCEAMQPQHRPVSRRRSGELRVRVVAAPHPG